VPETRVVEVPVERIVTVTVERPPPDAAKVCTRQACWRGRRSPVLHILEGGGHAHRVALLNRGAGGNGNPPISRAESDTRLASPIVNMKAANS